MLHLVAFAWFIGFWAWRKHKKQRGLNWPLIGMLPQLLLNVGQIHDVCTAVLSRTRRGTFLFRGPVFTNMEILMTANPSNVHYIMSANFKNFPKGARFKEIFDVLGEGIFNSDSDSWRVQRKVMSAMMGDYRFQRCVAKISHHKVECGLVQVLDAACHDNQVLDLQDVFQRLTFDTTCLLVTGYDPGCLSIEFPDLPFSKAMDDAEDAIFMRHVLPDVVWKLQRWLRVGSERKLAQARLVLDEVIGRYISMKREELLQSDSSSGSSDLLSCYINSNKGGLEDVYLRDTILNLMIAGRDTTSSALTWFTWLVYTNPLVEKKILEELKSINICNCSWGGDDGGVLVFQVEETNKLVYMHGALCEALRLYPPVPFQHKEAVEEDLLPSGHKVRPNMKVMLFLYAMGRMESIWGADCLEFKPERWLVSSRSIKHHPSYNFLAFNAGPRTCLGKQIAFTQMKAVASTIIYNYVVSVAEGHRVAPNSSLILYMRDGFKVRLTRRRH